MKTLLKKNVTWTEKTTPGNRVIYRLIVKYYKWRIMQLPKADYNIFSDWNIIANFIYSFKKHVWVTAAEFTGSLMFLSCLGVRRGRTAPLKIDVDNLTGMWLINS